MSHDTVAPNLVILVEYTLHSPQGDLLEATEGAPLHYLHGAGNIVRGVEEALLGRTVGDKLSLVVPPSKGYGPSTDAPEIAVPIENFSALGDEGEVELFEGLEVLAEVDDELVPHYITRIEDDVVMVSPEHPLAGMDLHFEIEIVGIREPTAHELEAGHAHDDPEEDCEI